jgi:integrase
MLALRWADVNFENRQIAVSRKVIHLPRQGFVFGEPKARSKRTLVVPDVRLESLCEVRTRQMSRMKELGTRLQENELIFCRAGGEPIYATTLNRAFTKLQLELGIDPVRWHDLRHTSVSILIKEGVHSKLIADRMGHSSVQITLDRYGHLMPGMQDVVAARLDGWIASLGAGTAGP